MKVLEVMTYVFASSSVLLSQGKGFVGTNFLKLKVYFCKAICLFLIALLCSKVMQIAQPFKEGNPASALSEPTSLMYLPLSKPC